MINNFELARVDYHTARLLKEKGFEAGGYEKCWLKTLSGEIIQSSERNESLDHSRAKLLFRQPTQDLALEWLLVNFGLMVHFSFSNDDQFYFDIEKKHKEGHIFTIFLREDIAYATGVKNTSINYLSLYDAKEAAINYCLTYLTD